MKTILKEMGWLGSVRHQNFIQCGIECCAVYHDYPQRSAPRVEGYLRLPTPVSYETLVRLDAHLGGAEIHYPTHRSGWMEVIHSNSDRKGIVGFNLTESDDPEASLETLAEFAATLGGRAATIAEAVGVVPSPAGEFKYRGVECLLTPGERERAGEEVGPVYVRVPTPVCPSLWAKLQRLGVLYPTIPSEWEGTESVRLTRIERPGKAQGIIGFGVPDGLPAEAKARKIALTVARHIWPVSDDPEPTPAPTPEKLPRTVGEMAELLSKYPPDTPLDYQGEEKEPMVLGAIYSRLTDRTHICLELEAQD